MSAGESLQSIQRRLGVNASEAMRIQTGGHPAIQRQPETKGTAMSGEDTRELVAELNGLSSYFIVTSDTTLQGQPIADDYRLIFSRTYKALREAASRLAAPPLVQVRALGMCPECGPVSAVDAERCCTGCGHDVAMFDRPTLVTTPRLAAPVGDYTAEELACKGCMGPCGRCHEAAPVGEQWQPIATAPKTRVLIAWADRPNWSPQAAILRADGEWTEADSDGAAHYRTPTHWMPLPEPPNV